MLPIGFGTRPNISTSKNAKTSHHRKPITNQKRNGAHLETHPKPECHDTPKLNHRGVS